MRHPLSLFLVLTTIGCGGRSVGVGEDSGIEPKVDLSVKVDGPAVVPDLSQRETGLEAVLQRLILPRRSSEFARDMDGDGRPDNQLARLLASVRGLFPMDLQQEVDRALAGGLALVLFRLVAGGVDVPRGVITDSPSAELRVFLGEDADDDPQNFRGDAIFTIAPASPRDVILRGRVKDRALAVQGSLLVPFPIGGQPALLTLQRAQLNAQLDLKKGMLEGVLGGAVPWTQVEEHLLPAIAEMLNGLGRREVLVLFDGDGDGKVSAKELASSPLVAAFFRPDVDLDGDGKPDALSMGFGFDTALCSILQ